MMRATVLSVLLGLTCFAQAAEMERIVVEGDKFQLQSSGALFTPWGFNYDHDTKDNGRLIEDYWHEEWATVEKDFAEMKDLGGNVVRVHLQFGKFMTAPDRPNQRELDRLRDLLKLAERTGLYLDLTGLACYHKADIPPWYDTMDEKERWAAQARFWEAIAATCKDSRAVFCYDLMNEPILPGKKVEAEWLAGELGGKFFVQRITLDLAGRTREQVAEAWVDQMVKAIRKHDDRTLITVGVIPWAMVWPNAKPLFYAPGVGNHLDFVSAHFYPDKDKVDEAIKALAVYDLGKPLVIEETFALKCPPEQFVEFLKRSRAHADGWISFYWGMSPEEYRQRKSLHDALAAHAIETFVNAKPQVVSESAK